MLSIYLRIGKNREVRSMKTEIATDFYIVAYEAGAEHPSLPTWANRSENPLALSSHLPQELLRRKEIDAVPGAFQIDNVLTAAECQKLIDLSETLGYLPDAAVSLPRTIRHNDNLVWVTDTQTDAIIWQRVANLANQQPELYFQKRALGLNARFRFYRYSQGDYFKPHTDGAWPGSRVIDGNLVANAYSDRYSLMTFLIFLNDNFSGGATRFLVPKAASGKVTATREAAEVVDVRLPQGTVLCFPHGPHPLHCVHSSEPVLQGVKYIIRTDMLFEL